VTITHFKKPLRKRKRETTLEENGRGNADRAFCAAEQRAPPVSQGCSAHPSHLLVDSHAKVTTIYIAAERNTVQKVICG